MLNISSNIVPQDDRPVRLLRDAKGVYGIGCEDDEDVWQPAKRWGLALRPDRLLGDHHCAALQMIVGGLIADVIAVIGSIDVVMGDVDR